jgi:putative oxidoreductase
MNKLLQLSFIPRSSDFALLLLRLWVGVPLFLCHGYGKAIHFTQTVGMMTKMDPIGLGGNVSAVLVIFAETVCAAAMVLGFATRLAALINVINLGVAFWFVHQHTLVGPHSGELAFLYLGGVVTLLLVGGGKFSFMPESGS